MSNELIYNALWHFEEKHLLEFDKAAIKAEQGLYQIAEECARNELSTLGKAGGSKSTCMEPSSEEISQWIQERRTRWEGEGKRKLTLRFCDDSRLSFTSFEEALAHTDVKNRRTESFEYVIQDSGRKFVANFNGLFAFGKKMRIEAGPTECKVARDFQTSLRQTIEDASLPLWQYWWSKDAISFPVMLVLLFLTLMYPVAAASAKLSANRSDFQNEVQGLVEGAITEEKFGKALELLLINSADLIHDGQRSEAKQTGLLKRYIIPIVFSIYFICLWQLQPHSELVLGTGFSSIKHQKWGARFVYFLTIPVFLLGFIIPYLNFQLQ